MAAGSLADYRRVRSRYDCDVNDVVLAVIAGALRNWLLSRGEPVTTTSTVRAMAPTSVYPEAELESSGPGQAISEVAPFLVDLPVGEGNPVVRLSQIAHATESHSAAATLVDARTIVTLSGFAPPTLHAMGTRVATQFSARQFNLFVGNALEGGPANLVLRRLGPTVEFAPLLGPRSPTRWRIDAEAGAAIDLAGNIRTRHRLADELVAAALGEERRVGRRR